MKVFTTGVRTCCSTGFCCRVLYRSNTSSPVESIIAIKPKTTPTLNHNLVNQGLNWPILRKSRLKLVVYHLTCPMETDNPVVDKKLM